MSYKIGVVAHTKRADQAHRLMEDVGAVYMNVDNGTLGCDAAHRKVWSWLAAHAEGVDHLLVLEDDALPVPAFTVQLGKVLTATPASVIGLYLGTGYPPHLQPKIQEAIGNADKQDACFITTTQLLHGVGIAIKTDLVPDMLAYQDTRPFDYRIRNWANTRGHRIALCLPSIVDHADQPSLVKHPDGGTRTEPRKAWRVGGRDEWTPKAVNL